MSESIPACVGRFVLWEVVICSTFLGIAIYELVGVIWVHVSQRHCRVECTKCLQSLISLSLVIYLAVSVWFLCYDFNDGYNCNFLHDLMWFSFLALTTLIYMFYYIKQQVLVTAMNTNKLYYCLRPLHFLSICLIPCIPLYGLLWPFLVSLCSWFPSHALAFNLIFILLDFICVLTLLVLFLLPLWRFTREDYLQNNNQDYQVIKSLFVRNAFLGCFSLLTSVGANATIVILGFSNPQKRVLRSQLLCFSIELFIVSNCVLFTMSDWPKMILWSCNLTRQIKTTFNQSSSLDKHEIIREKLLSP